MNTIMHYCKNCKRVTFHRNLFVETHLILQGNDFVTVECKECKTTDRTEMMK